MLLLPSFSFVISQKVVILNCYLLYSVFNEPKKNLNKLIMFISHSHVGKRTKKKIPLNCEQFLFHHPIHVFLFLFHRSAIYHHSFSFARLVNIIQIFRIRASSFIFFVRHLFLHFFF